MVWLIDELPECLFNCKSLKLLRFKFSLHFKLPSCSIYLPALKAIHLSTITFNDDNLSKLLANCPILEALVLMEVEFHMLEKFTIFAPQLKHLTIHKCNDVDYSDPNFCKIEIFAPNLISFWCNDHIAREFSVETFSSPVIAEFDMRVETIYIYESEKGILLPEEKNEEYALHVVKYLKAVCNVRTLSLSPWLIEVVSKSPVGLQSLSMQFLNLRHLELKTWLSGNCVHGIIHLLNVSPNVDTLIVKVTKKPWVHIWEGNEWLISSEKIRKYRPDPELSLQCMYHLKYVQIHDVLGCINGLQFMEILLKNAVVLETMGIFVPKGLPNRKERVTKFSEKLQQIPRCTSSSIIISFC